MHAMPMTPPGEPTAPGSLLAQERQRQGLSVGDIAAKLRMSVVQVEALERADYSRLPTGTFLRGFVRSYAKQLGLDPEPMLRLLEDTHAGGRRPSIVVPSQNIKIAAPGEGLASPRGRWTLIGLLVLALLGGFAYWLFNISPEQGSAARRSAKGATSSAGALKVPQASPGSPSDAVTAAATQEKSDVGTTAVLQPQTTPVTTTAPAVAAAAGAKPVLLEKPAAPVIPPGSGRLQFSFTGDSWVEVVEATGKTLVSRRFKSGETERVTGRLPVSVVIGNATLTRFVYNDVEFDLSPHTRVAVARFTLK